MNKGLAMEARAELADLLFGAGGGMDTGAYEAMYPGRGLPDGACVTRLGPSPTGFAHLGNLFMATVNGRLARQSGGVFYLRIEDTDRKREVEGAVPELIDVLARFGVEFGEGATADGEEGRYGPYRQSERRAIYHAYARRLVLEGKAYPCFLTEGEIADIRAGQEEAKLLPGVYGRFAKWRGACVDEVRGRMAAGCEWTLRLNADWSEGQCAADGAHCGDDAQSTIHDPQCATGAGTVEVVDGIRGRLSFPRNVMDVVVLKADGLPTYHFAHVVDDHLMRTTHVVRGEEWLPSLPVHIALSEALGFDPPIYCHTALLMKSEGGARRKLSKRKDPELALSYYLSEGYHPKAVEEYMLTVINSDYEEWRLANPLADNAGFEVRTGKMGASGILFDLVKLQDVSRETLLRVPAGELADFLIGWARRERPDAYAELLAGRETLVRAIGIGRDGDKPRKDFSHAKQMLAFLSYFFDGLFAVEEGLPERVGEEDAALILSDYLAGYCHADGRDEWFGKIRAIAEARGYAAKPKDYKNDPEAYKGHVGDVSAAIRLAIVGRKDSPDLWEVQQALGEKRVRERCERFRG